MFVMTFNRAAVRTFFPSDGTVGVLVRLGVPPVAFRPATSRTGGDIAMGRLRSRGGFEVTVEGTGASELLTTLEAMSEPSRPFFLLHRLHEDWLEPIHYAHDGDPPRSEPHMRLRVPEQAIELPPALADHPSLNYADVVRHAAEIVTTWQDARRSGRPPREVEDARHVMTEFANLVKEVRPALLLAGAIDLNLVRQARDALSDVLGETGNAAGKGK